MASARVHAIRASRFGWSGRGKRDGKKNAAAELESSRASEVSLPGKIITSPVRGCEDLCAKFSAMRRDVESENSLMRAREYASASKLGAGDAGVGANDLTDT